jgi:hypothetical protein
MTIAALRAAFAALSAPPFRSFLPAAKLQALL